MALSGSKVCELYRKNRYDLILLDIQMPDMDGFQEVEGLKEIGTDGYLLVIGPIQATHETKKTIPLSPIVGRAMLGSGIVLVIKYLGHQISRSDKESLDTIIKA